MYKGVVAFTDLPMGAQELFIAHHEFLAEVSYEASLFGNAADNFL